MPFISKNKNGGINTEESKDFYRYKVYCDGRIFSTIRDKFLTPDNVQGYDQYTLAIDGKPKRFKAHRLVAMLFLDPPDNYSDLVVNHKDGDKKNNHYTNLEWCSYDYNNYHARATGLNNVSKSNSDRWNDKEFRDKASKNISEGILKSGCSSWKNNPRFRYEITDEAKEYTRTELSRIIEKSQSYTDAIIKRAANGEKIQILEKHNIQVNDTKSKVNRLSKA